MAEKAFQDISDGEVGLDDELMREDADLAIDDDLDADLAEVDRSHSRSVRQGRTPSQVYSIRVPVERLEEIRNLAATRGVPPTVMLREWIIEYLDREIASSRASGDVLQSEAVKRPPTREGNVAGPATANDGAASALETATRTLTAVAQKLTDAISVLGAASMTEGGQSYAVEVPEPAGPRPFSPDGQHSLPVVASMRFAHSFARHSIAMGGFESQSSRLTHLYVTRGVQVLRATVEDISSHHLLGESDLNDVYSVVDEELSRP